jgi:hypothetical protein
MWQVAKFNAFNRMRTSVSLNWQPRKEKEETSIEAEHNSNVSRIQHSAFMALNHLYVLDEIIPDHLSRIKTDDSYRKIDAEDFTNPMSSSPTENIIEILEDFKNYQR